SRAPGGAGAAGTGGSGPRDAAIDCGGGRKEFRRELAPGIAGANLAGVGGIQSDLSCRAEAAHRKPGPAVHGNGAATDRAAGKADLRGAGAQIAATRPRKVRGPVAGRSRGVHGNLHEGESGARTEGTGPAPLLSLGP